MVVKLQLKIKEPLEKKSGYFFKIFLSKLSSYTLSTNLALYLHLEFLCNVLHAKKAGSIWNTCRQSYSNGGLIVQAREKWCGDVFSF